MNDHHFSYITIFKKETLILRSTYLTNLKRKTLAYGQGVGERRRRKKKVSKREAIAQTDLEERKKKQARKTPY
jgi:hypothetical protein